MPRRDGTGPRGEGPLTGWGQGPCYDDGGYAYDRRGRRRAFGPGRGFRRGYGRGYGWGFGPGFVEMPYDDRSDRELLEEERDLLQRRLDTIAKQLEEE